MVTGEGGGRTTPDHDIQDMPDTDPITQALAALEKRLAIELKVFDGFGFLLCAHTF